MHYPVCSSCIFWKQEGPDDNAVGHCRANPPSIVSTLVHEGHQDLGSLEQVAYATRFPITSWDAWCGRWQNNPAVIG